MECKDIEKDLSSLGKDWHKLALGILLWIKPDSYVIGSSYEWDFCDKILKSDIPSGEELEKNHKILANMAWISLFGHPQIVEKGAEIFRRVYSKWAEYKIIELKKGKIK